MPEAAKKRETSDVKHDSDPELYDRSVADDSTPPAAETEREPAVTESNSSQLRREFRRRRAE